MSDYTVRYRIGVDTGTAAENLDKVTKAGERTDQKLKQVTNTAAGGSGSATNAMTNFNRVMQDAPYGVMGVANNIDPLVQSFQKLKAETGSTGGALKSMLGVLSGPTGVLFGVNAVILAIQVLPGIFSKASAALSGTTEKMRELTNATKAQSIFSNEAIVKNLGEAKAIEELGKQLLKTNAGTKQRKEVLNQIKAINPDILKGIDEHTTSEKKLKAAIDKATGSIWDKISASLTDIFLAPSYAKLAEAYTKYTTAFEKQSSASKRAWDPKNPTTDEEFRQANRSMDDARLALQKVQALFSKDLVLATTTVNNLLGALGRQNNSGGNTNDNPTTNNGDKTKTKDVIEPNDYFIIKRPIGEDFRKTMAAEDFSYLFPALDMANVWRAQLPAIKETKFEIADLLMNTSKSFDEFTGYSEQLASNFDNAFGSLANGLTQALFGFSRLDLALKSFIVTLGEAIVQTTIFSFIQAGLGALFGPIGMSGWISKNIFGVDVAGGRSLTGGVGISSGNINLLRNISRQTMNFGGEIVLRATGSELKKTIKAEELFRVQQR